MTKFVQNDIDFNQYVVCIKCYALYDYTDCFVSVDGNNVTKTCSFVEFPNHRLPHFRRPCGQSLLYEVVNISSKKILNPYKTFCYKSVKSSLQRLVFRNNFEDMCEQWRFLERKEGIMCDVYDGKIWKEFNGGKIQFCYQRGKLWCNDKC